MRLVALASDRGPREPENTRPGRENTRSAIAVDLTQLRPVEVVLLCRYASESSTDEFPSIDACCEDIKRQLRELPEADLPFARKVYFTFATSTNPADRLIIGFNLRAMTLADRETGLALWSQLVRDEHPVVRRDVYEQIQRHFDDPARLPEHGLAEEGLRLDEGERLRDAYIRAQYAAGQHVVERTAVAEALEEATSSFRSFGMV